MDIKYLTDAKGTVTGVLLSPEEWERLKRQYGIREEAQPESGAKLQKGLGDALRKAGLPEEGGADAGGLTP